MGWEVIWNLKGRNFDKEYFNVTGNMILHIEVLKMTLFSEGMRHDMKTRLIQKEASRNVF